MACSFAGQARSLAALGAVACVALADAFGNRTALSAGSAAIKVERVWGSHSILLGQDLSSVNVQIVSVSGSQFAASWPETVGSGSLAN